MAEVGARACRILTPFGLALLAFAVRGLPWPSVLDGDRVYFFGTDAYYHMRRILYALTHFPASLEFDPYLNFPHGAKPIWSPLFDTLMACALTPFHRFGDELTVERAAVWLPPLLGTLTVLTLYFLAKRHFGCVVAVASSLVLCFLSAHFWYSQVGFVDHHAAVSLAATLMLASALSLFRRLSRATATSPAVVANGLLVGVLMAGSLLVWPGSLLYVALIELALLAFLMSRESRAEAVGFARLLALVQTVALLLVLPSGLRASWPQWGDFTPTVISRFQPWMFGSLALHSAGCAALWRWSGAGAARRWRALQAVAVGVAVASVSALAFPGLLVGASDAWRWMARDEAFQGLVMESFPLFQVDGSFGVRIAELRLSRFIYLFPFAVVVLWQEARRSEQRAELLLLVWWSLVLAVVTVAQRRFFNTFSVVFALIMGWSAVWLYRALVDLLPGFRARKLVTGVAVAALFVTLLAPVFGAYRGTIDAQLAAIRGEPRVLGKWQRSRRVLVDAAEWLRVNTPPTSGFLDPEVAPEYGVLCQWGDGHVLKYEARRPTVVGNFGDDLGGENFRLSFAYFESGEGRAIRILEELKVRYVFVSTVARPARDSLHRSVMIRRLSENEVLDLERHRLVYESPTVAPGVRNVRPAFRIFEFVKGVHLTGQANPGKRVSAQLSCLTNRGRETLVHRASRADSNGHYALTLPYATRGAPPAVLCDAAYTVVSEGRRLSVAVDEDQVQQGASVEGPDLRAEVSP
jgi:asparagine N-glycosylation enzyme membrane subunit Stt3